MYEVEGERYLDAFEVALCKRSLYAFVEFFWDVLEPTQAFIPARHMEEICKTLEAVKSKRVQKLCVNIPPGHAKSNIFSVAYPAWRWATDPKWSALFASYDAALSERDSVRTRDLIQCERYQAAFVRNPQTGEAAWKLRDDTNRTELYKNTEGGFRISTSVGGTGTGWRVDEIIVDDPLNAKHSHSEAHRNAANNWFTKALSSRHKNPQNPVLVVVMQRLHADDLCGHLERKQMGFQFLRLPSFFEPSRRSVVVDKDGVLIAQDWRQEKDDLLFPQMYSEEVLLSAKRTMGDAFAGQHQQRPSPEEGGLFKKKYWRFWRQEGTRAEDQIPRPEGCYTGPAVALPPRFDMKILSLDASFKDGKKNDFVCFLILGVRKADIFILDCVNKKLDFTKTVETLKALVKKHPGTSRKLVEDKANGTAVINTLRGKIAGIIPLETEGGKESRAAAAQPTVESGNVFLPEGAHWVEDFIEQFALFPNDLHDDQVDALTQAINYISQKPEVARAAAMSRL